MGGYSGFGPFPARSPPPGQHAYNVLPYTPNTHYVYRASRCKCEIVKLQLAVKVFYAQFDLMKVMRPITLSLYPITLMDKNN